MRLLARGCGCEL